PGCRPAGSCRVASRVQLKPAARHHLRMAPLLPGARRSSVGLRPALPDASPPPCPADSAPAIQTDAAEKKSGRFLSGGFAAGPGGGYGWVVVDVSTATIEVAAGRHSRWVVVSRWEPLPRLYKQPGPRSQDRGPVHFSPFFLPSPLGGEEV